MLFIPDPNKYAVEILFSKKQHEKGNYPPLHFNVNKVQTAISQKHLGLVLDAKLDFNEHISNKINKCSKIMQGCQRTWKTLKTWGNLEFHCVTWETWKIKENFLETWETFFF